MDNIVSASKKCSIFIIGAKCIGQYGGYRTVGICTNKALNDRLPNTIQIREMAKEVDLEEFYVSYRIDCHFTHGDWVDITRYFLEKKDGKYYPYFGEYESDIRKLNPMLEIVYKSIFEFLKYIDGHGIDEGIREELEEDLKVIRELDSMHFDYIQRLGD